MASKSSIEESHHVHAVIKGRRLFDFEASLPPLPVPELKRSVQMYSSALQPLLKTPAEVEAYGKLVEDFLAPSSPAHKLYEMLQDRARRSGPHTDYPHCSWLEEWWDKYAYLSWAEPLAINVNFFGTVALPQPSSPQLACAAAAVHCSLLFWKLVRSGDLPPDSLDGQGKHPLSSFQYTRLFSSTRLPSETCDSIVGFPSSDHIAVASRGFWFKMTVLDPHGEPLSPAELLTALRYIDSRSAQLCRDGAPTEPVGLLTAENRKVWARCRAQLVETPVYRRGIETIEGAMFNLSLSSLSPASEAEVMLNAELGDADLGDYWFDKSSTLFAFKNGALGFGGEHAHADAPIPARAVHTTVLHLADGVLLQALTKQLLGPLDAAEAHHCEKIDFPPSPQLTSALESARAAYKAAIALNELAVLEHHGVNKAVLKRLQVSPDSFFQMAMQLAYFRDQGCHTATYETASTRAFFHGRTETIRPLSQESTAWVHAMHDAGAPPSVRLALLHKAMHSHTTFLRSASFGQGCDRLLFGLRIIALENGLPLPPLLASPLFARGGDFGLSTSNMSNSLGGIPGFGAPFPTSYGVCYNMRNDWLKACVTSNKSCTAKSATRFVKAISTAIDDMLLLFSSQQTSSSKPRSSL